MKYYVASRNGKTMVFSQAALKGSDQVLHSAVVFDPRDVAVQWFRKQGKQPKYVKLGQRAFGCWEIDSDLKE